MRTTRRIPHQQWFNEMRKAVKEAGTPATKKQEGVPASQIALAAKLKGDPSMCHRRRWEEENDQ